MDNLINLCKFGNLLEFKKESENIPISELSNTLICTACEYDKLDILEWLVSLKQWYIKISSDQDSYKYESLFCYCCRNGYLSAAKHLYQNIGVDIHEKDEEGFSLTCYGNHLQLAKWLYSLGGIDINNNSNYPLKSAVNNGHYEMVKWLMSLPDIDTLQYDKIVSETCGGNLDIIKLFDLSGNINITSFSIVFAKACTLGKFEIMKWLYDNKDIDIHIYDELVFRTACSKNYLDIAKWIYSLGDIDIYFDFNTLTQNNGIAFEDACYYGNLEVVKWLYQVGDIDIHDKDNLSFIISCSKGHLELAKWIHSLTESVNARLCEEAFIGACNNSHLEVAKWIYGLTNINIHISGNITLYDLIIGGNLTSILWLYNLDNDESWKIWNLSIYNNILSILCESGNLQALKWFYKTYYHQIIEGSKDSDKVNYRLFKLACKYNRIETTKWLYNGELQLSPDKLVKFNTYSDKNNEIEFINACELGNLEVVKWLYGLGGIDIHINCDLPFISACRKGHLEIMDWLSNLGSIIHTKQDIAIKFACLYNHLEVVKWIYYKDTKYFTDNYRVFEIMFSFACENNNISIIKWLYNNIYQDVKNTINKKLIENSFITVCYYGYLQTAQWFYATFDIDDKIPELSKIYSKATIDNLRLAMFLHSIGYKINIEEDRYLYMLKIAIEKHSLKTLDWIYNTYPEYSTCLTNTKDVDSIENISTILFLLACERGNIGIFTWLYAKIGVDVISTAIFHTLIKYERVEIFKWLYNESNDKNISLLFLIACENNKLNMAKWIYLMDTNKIIDINGDEEYLFRVSCGGGYLNLTKWLYSLCNIDINIRDNNPFLLACQEGHLNVAKWLYSLKDIDISISLEDSFIISCSRGYLRVAKWLYEIGADVNYNEDEAWQFSMFKGRLSVVKWLYSTGLIDVRCGNSRHIINKKDYAFKMACESGYIDIIKWLESICDLYSSEYYNDRYIWLISDTPYPVEYYIKHNDIKNIVERLNIKKVSDLKTEECIICYEKSDTLTNCNHPYCLECLMKWYNKPCAYCKQDIQYEICQTLL